MLHCNKDNGFSFKGRIDRYYHKQLAINKLNDVVIERILLRVGLHWRVPFIEDLSETVQVVW